MGTYCDLDNFDDVWKFSLGTQIWRKFSLVTQTQMKTPPHMHSVEKS